MRKNRLAAIHLLWLAVIGAALPGTAAAEPAIELKISHYLPPSHGIHQDFIEPWARELEARTNGRVAVTIHPGNTAFGDITRQLDQVRAGVVDIAHGLSGLPRGIKYQVRLRDGAARGYVCENHGGFFRLPELGPIGANGLANPRDFLAPVAAYEERRGDFELLVKYGGGMWRSRLDHSPLDVVAWHGNHPPYKYDLARFNTINTVSFDHPDPSIFTVLTAPSDTPGTANVDFVIFPPRWLVAEHTFRPPYFHRNVMSELMGLVHGAYDAKAHGFEPGGASLHNCMTPHGPDAETFERAASAELEPQFLGDTLAFMLESRYPFRATEQARAAAFRQRDYVEVWQGLEPRFDRRRP